MRAKSVVLRLLAVALCFCLVMSDAGSALSMATGLNFGMASAQAAWTPQGNTTPDTLNHVADPATLGDYLTSLNINSNSRNAGRIWTDKSVFANGSDNASGTDWSWNGSTGTLTLHEGLESGNGYAMPPDSNYNSDVTFSIANTPNADFLHVFSVIGSSQQVNTEMARPLDVVLLLDISTSMTDGSNTDPLHQMINAANSLIERLMNVSNDPSISADNRVGVVLYGGGTQILLPLNHYARTGNSPFIEVQSETALGNQSHYFPLIKATGTAAGFTTKTSEYFYADATYLQGALAQGMQMLVDADNLTVIGNNGKEIKRKPILVVLSDGGTNVVTADSTTGKKVQTFDPFNGESGSPWYQPYVGILPVQTNNVNDGGHYWALQGNPVYSGLTSNRDHGWELMPAEMIANLMLAGSMKKRIEAHYGMDENDEQIKMMGFSIMVNSANLRTNEKQQMYTTLDPAHYFNATSRGPGDQRNGENTNNYEDYTYAREAFNQFNQTFLNENRTLTMRARSGWIDGYNASNAINAIWNFTHLTGENAKFDIDTIEDLYYIDTALKVETSNESIQNIFDQILETVTTNAFIPISGTNDLGVSNALTFIDPIGKYMDVKDVAGILLFGHQFPVTRAGVYNYDLNDAYMDKYAKQGQPFARGWYLKKTDENGVEYLDGDTGPGYPANDKAGDDDHDRVSFTKLKEWFEKKGKSSEFPYANEAEARANGWEFYFDLNTITQFVPNLEDYDPDTAEGDVRNITYTAYRFTQDTLGNPSYGRINSSMNGDVREWDQYLMDFSLTDIRIWVEDSGDWVDQVVADSPSMISTEYDEALYISLPAAALPVIVAKINLNADGETLDTSNGGYSVNDVKPLRVIYTVGMEEDLLNKNGQIDLTRVNRNYLNNNRSGGEGNSVYFYSNWYESAHRYHGYATDATQNGYSYGDAMLSFSPDTTNRYYMFQKNLPLYATGLQYMADGTGVNFADLPFIMGVESTNSTTLDISGKKLKTRAGDDYNNPNNPLGAQTSLPVVDEVGEVASDSWYYIVIDYYDKTGLVHAAIPRLGSELGSGIEGAEAAEYLVWYQLGSEGGETQPFSVDKPSDGNTWVVATAVGGPRVGAMAQNVTNKGTEYNGEGILNNNRTATSNTVFLPTVHANTGTGTENNSIVIDVYLGNNGRLEVGDTLLLVTKQLTAHGEGGTVTAEQQSLPFHYQVYVDGFVGAHDAVMVQYSPYSNSWQRRIDTIDVNTNNDNFLLDASGSLAVFNKDGTRNTDVTVEQRSEGYVVTNGDANLSDLYFVYLPAAVSAKGNKVDTGSTHVRRIFINGESDNVSDLEDPENPGILLQNTGRTLYVGKEDFNRVRNSQPGRNGLWFEEEDDDHPAGSIAYWVTDAKLVPANNTANPEGCPNYPQGDPRKEYNISSQLTLALLRPSDDPWSSNLQGGTTYDLNITYLTKTLYFGYKEDGVTELNASDLKDSTGGIDHDNTACFTLKHNEGLLIPGIDQNTDYRVTEWLDKATEDFSLQQLTHFTHQSLPNGIRYGVNEDGTPRVLGSGTNISANFGAYNTGVGDSTLPFYSVYGDTLNVEEAAHFVNYAPNVLKDETTPGEGEGVQVGSLIEYDIYWENTAVDSNGAATAGQVIVEDPLDPGVDFVSASYNPENDMEVMTVSLMALEEPDYTVTLEAQQDEDGNAQTVETTFEQITSKDGVVQYTDFTGTHDQQLTIRYDKATHTVTWTFNKAYPQQISKVHLVVRVNNNATQNYVYPEEGAADDRPVTGPGGDNDTEVLNRASVRVDSNPKVYTEVIENPIGGPDKTETHVEHVNPEWNGEPSVEVTDEGDDANLRPKEGAANTVEGPTVRPGDIITYRIDWQNTRMALNSESGSMEYVSSTVFIRDILDDNVDFVRAYGNTAETNVLNADADNPKTAVRTNRNSPFNNYAYTMLTAEGTELAVNNGSLAMLFGMQPVKDVGTTRNDYPGTVTAYPNTESDTEDDETQRTVFFVIRDAAANSFGSLYIDVQVKDEAEIAGYVDNQAHVQVENQDEQSTRIVENPVPSKDKEETNPGAGHPVLVGDELDYEIAWRNETPGAANVVITDKLDPGVDFVSASYPYTNSTGALTLTPVPERWDKEKGVYTITGQQTVVVDGVTMPRIQITYDPAAHTVTWTLAQRPARGNDGSSGVVTLKTRVNDQAVKEWNYDVTTENPDGWTNLPPLGTEQDMEVFNRAGVRVGNQDEVLTKVVENPVEQKTETDPGVNLSPIYPGETGDAVEVGQQVTYALDWKYPSLGPDGQPAPDGIVTIVDKLDPGVEFVSAALGTAQATKDKAFSGTISIEGVTEPVNVTITYYNESASGDHYPHSVEYVLTNVPAGALGRATLTVEVTEDAKKVWVYDNTTGEVYEDGWTPTGGVVADNDLRIVNQARFEITEAGNTYGVTTGPIYNPVGKPEKEEVDPGDGERVTVGQEIKYTVEWQNNATDPTTGEAAAATVVITDKLDPGVDFVSAEFPYVPEEAVAAADVKLVYPELEATSNDGKVTIQYYPDGDNSDPDHPIAPHTVVWTLKDRPANSEGLVGLTVRANDDAPYDWDYDSARTDVDKTNPDWMVYNQAGVRVGNQDEVKTKIVENPLDGKTETSVGKNTNPELHMNADGHMEGPTVHVGDSVGYRIFWVNDATNTDASGVEAPAKAVMRVVDKLDPGVDFVSATLFGSTLTVNADTPEANHIRQANGTVEITVPGAEGTEPTTVTIPAIIRYYTPDYEPAVSAEDTPDTTEPQPHSIEWILGEETDDETRMVPAGATGYVDFQVTVNENARKTYNYPGTVPPGTTLPDDDDDWQIINRGRIFANDAGHYTDTVTNPTGGPDKEETDPGNGKLVGVGDEITYEVTWHNDQTDDALITVTDKLDPGVDFEQATYVLPDTGEIVLLTKDTAADENGVKTVKSADEKITISYYPNGTEDGAIPPHTVVWDLGVQAAGKRDTVELKVRVNGNAKKSWKYGDDPYGEGWTAPGYGEGEDLLVRNQAVVEVNNNPQVTREVENPVPKKEEPTPGPDEGVQLGDPVTYEISVKVPEDYVNEAGQTVQGGYVKIVDPLDVGLDFVSASYGDVKLDLTVTPVDGVYKVTGNATYENYTDAAGQPIQVPVTITYYGPDSKGDSITAGEETVEIKPHTIVWTVGQADDNLAPGGTMVTVGFTATVNEEAKVPWDDENGTNDREEDNRIVNRAYVVTNDGAGYTERIVNPIYEPEKTETYPGDGKLVEIGSTVKYEVTWMNYHDQPATVIVTDKLDPGVDFALAAYKTVELNMHAEEAPKQTEGGYYSEAGQVTIAGETIDVEIRYYPQGYNTDGKPIDDPGRPHAVVWILKNVPDGMEDTVQLETVVNENAVKTWGYGTGTDKSQWDKEGWKNVDPNPEELPDTLDQKIYNRAGVKVGDDDELLTNIPENPVEGKTETEINDNPDIDLEITEKGTVKGEGVQEEDTVTYRLYWVNDAVDKDGKPAAATVKIVDKLDPGVDFVSASYNGKTMTAVTGSTEPYYEMPLESTGLYDPENPDGTVGEDDVDTYIRYYTSAYPGTGTGAEAIKPHTVKWSIGEQPAGATGYVELKVRVNENAVYHWEYGDVYGDNSVNANETKDDKIVNRGRIFVGNEPGRNTNLVENPTGGPDKQETDPGAGVLVGVGKEITYEITWENDEARPADIVITDKLDPGVDFVKAANVAQKSDATTGWYTVENDGGIKNITYDAEHHMVTWTLENQAVGAKGTVTLVVRVNEKAVQYWDYNATYDETGTTTDSTKENDLLVRNQAKVAVDNNAKVTRKVENPVPEKQETKPGDGQQVKVGDQIDYEVSVKVPTVDTDGTALQGAVVTVTDPLDIGMTFVKASYGDVILTADEASVTGEYTYYPDTRREVKVPVTITYDAVNRVVVWTIGAKNEAEPAQSRLVPAGEKVTVTLTAEVNEKAPVKWDDDNGEEQGETDNEVNNRARVAVNEASGYTNRVHNPVGQPEKTETTPGTGLAVAVGDEITYEVTWKNYRGETANVVITDKLDLGVDFASAAYGEVKLTAGNATVTEGNVTVAYDAATHTVTWTLENQPKEASGAVTLTVQVNEKAFYGWNYDETEDNPDGWSNLPKEPDMKVEDKMVYNRAGVKVGNDAEQLTDIPWNPLDHKTEVAVGDREKIELHQNADGTALAGPKVAEGDLVTYRIYWANDATKEDDNTAFVDAVMQVVDKLDPGAEFVQASYKLEEGKVLTLTPDVQANAQGVKTVGTEDGKIKISYYTRETAAGATDNAGTEIKPHTVVWNLGEQKANATGYVELTVQVNANAAYDWSYGEVYGDDATLSETEKDQLLKNRGRVLSGEATHNTNAIENPTGGPEKTEVTPGAGVMVDVEKEITYEITWENYKDKTAEVIVVRDKLDPGVDFVSAEYGEVALNANAGADASTESGNVSIRYDAAEHMVTWVLAKQAAGANGSVTLTVKVNANAHYEWSYAAPDADVNTGEKDHMVYNRASVQVDTDNEIYTDIVENPLPYKEEVTPGAGETVSVGEEIAYKIHWQNNATTASGEAATADVVVTDKLDPGVDFVSAGYGEVKLTAGNATVTEGNVTVAYDAATHTVTWTLKSQAAKADDYVDLTVKVNEKAELAWSYEAPEAAPTEEKDLKVLNQARITVNGSEYKTDIVENPTGGPEKTEVTPGAGVMVDVGKEITYEITWENYKDKTAEVIVVRDKLDPGVDFVTAGYKDGAPKGETPVYDTATHTVTWTLKNQEAGANGTVTLTVKVNANAHFEWTYADPNLNASEKDHMVYNRASVQVDTDNEIYTDIVENPLPDKTETQINGTDVTVELGQDGTKTGRQVQIGDTITYQISWTNGHDTEADVIISDILDKALDFVSADNDGQYSEATRAVVWTLHAKAHESGLVTLTVKVNGSAKATADGGYEIVNKAAVRVGDDPLVETSPVENPTPGKTETKVNDGTVTPESLQPDDKGGLMGPAVEIGDTIEYRISFRNSYDRPAKITVKDPLDPGVDFVSAAYGEVTLTADGSQNVTVEKETVSITYDAETRTVTWTLKEFPANTAGYVTLTVLVNDKAQYEWNPGDTELGTGKDDMVRNQAGVQIDDEPEAKTEIPDNPVGEPKTGTLTVTKTVTGEGADETKAFTFTVRLSDVNINGTYGDMTFVNGVASFTLKHGESKKATGLPAGVHYTVIESLTEEDNYTSSAVGDTGVIEGGKESTAAFLNTFTPPPEIPKTGDRSHPEFWMTLTLLALLGLIWCAMTGKKRSER